MRVCDLVYVYTCLWLALCEPKEKPRLVYIKLVVCVTVDDDWVTLNVFVSSLLKAKLRSTSVT